MPADEETADNLSRGSKQSGRRPVATIIGTARQWADEDGRMRLSEKQLRGLLESALQPGPAAEQYNISSPLSEAQLRQILNY
eukprot:5196570-Pyramimonas_sp.AAC.1